MKRSFLTVIALVTIQLAIAQQKCNLANIVPWIVLNGQMVDIVQPKESNDNQYVLQFNSSAPIAVVKTEEMQTLTKTETINGIQRWFVVYKPNKARTISTAIVKCGCEVYVMPLEQQVILKRN